MWGAVIGDIVGSRFEGGRGGPKDFELFHRHCRYTDDTVCTAAVADILLNDRKPDSDTPGLVPAPSRARLRGIVPEMDRKRRSCAVRELREWRRHAGVARGAPLPRPFSR